MIYKKLLHQALRITWLFTKLFVSARLELSLF